jgi:hypothetical protein
MQKSDFQTRFKKLLPHLIAIVALYAVAAIFYWPAISEGDRLALGDTANFIGMSHETLSYADIDVERPAWTNSMFGGMPTVQITGTGIMTLPKYIWAFFRLLMSTEIMTLFLAMFSAYILAVCLKAKPLLAFIVGATFGLSSLNILYMAAGHATKVRAIAIMPAVLGGVIMAYRQNRWLGAGIAALALALHLDSNHLQMTYYLMYIVGAVGVTELIVAFRKGAARKALITSVVLVGAAFAAVLPSIPNLTITKNYSSYTTRGEAILPAENAQDAGLDKDYILEYSMAKGEWLSMMIPDIKGGADQLYWGEQRFSGGAVYFGAIAFALMLAFFFVGKDPMRWPLFAVTALAVILSWRDASELTDFFLEYVPLFNKFRDTKMMLVIVQLAVATGATLAVREILDSKNWKPWIYALSGISFVLVLFYAIPTSIFDFSSSVRPDIAVEQIGIRKAEELRLEIFRADVMRSLILILLATGAVFASMKTMIKREIALVILCVLMVGEIYNVDKRYKSRWVSEFEAEFPYEPTKAEMNILAVESQNLEGYADLKDQHMDIIEEELGHKLTRRHARAEAAAAFRSLNALTNFRVYDWGNPFNDAKTSYFNKSIGGYHGAKLRRYQDFIEHILTPEREEFAASVESMGIGLAKQLLKGASMMNTKYMLLPGAEGPLPLDPLGPAWFVSEIKIVETDLEELDGIRAINPATTALVHSDFESAVASATADSTASVVMTQYHPEGCTYSTSSSKESLLVLSEIWYPEGWSATIDGETADIIRANYILRALIIPAGEHEVQLSYVPQGLATAGILGNVGSLLLLLFLGLSFCKGASLE